MADEPNYNLVDFSETESKEVSEELQAVLAKHDGIFHIKRLVDESNGTFQAVLQIFKKVPKEEGIPSPIQAEDLKENGGTNSAEEGETKPDAETA